MKAKLALIAIASGFLLFAGCSKDATTSTVPKPSSQQTQTYYATNDTTAVSKDGTTFYLKGSGFTNSKGQVYSYNVKPTNGAAVK